LWDVFLGKTLAIIWRICYDGGTEQIKRKPIGVRRIDFALPDGFTDLYRGNRGVCSGAGVGCEQIILGKEVEL
jgi:hypothetical protein